MKRARLGTAVTLLASSLLSVAMIACASTSANVAPEEPIADQPVFASSKEAPKDYQEALTQIEEEKYELALQQIDAFLQRQPTSRWTQAALLHRGRALEGLERWSEAAQVYRTVIQATNTAPKIQVMALYRLSFCHEALADDQQTVAVLHDLLSRKRYLPNEIAEAELPARLAAAYARVGNSEKAAKHYKAAETGVSKLRTEAGEKIVPPWLPRTLYFMGSLALRHVTWNDFESALRPLARAQIYLLEAAELGVKPWNEKAARDLMATYRDLWSAIMTPPIEKEAGDPVITRRALQSKQWDRAALLLENLFELRARALPENQRGAKGDPDVAKQIMAFTYELEKQVHQLLSERPAGEGLTPEAQARRRGVKGKVVQPDPSLERKFLQDSRGVEKGDPNL